MAKKIGALILVLAAVLALNACVGSGTVKVDEQSNDASVRIESYLESAEDYFTVPDTSVILQKVEKKEDALNVLIEESAAKRDLPEELVNSYVESFRAYFGGDASDASEDDTALEDEAKSLIKSEMVIYIAYERFQLGQITAEDMKAKAEELAGQYSTDASSFYTEGGDNYVVQSAIREERVKAKLEADVQG